VSAVCDSPLHFARGSIIDGARDLPWPSSADTAAGLRLMMVLA